MAIFTVKRGSVRYYSPMRDNDQNLGTIKHEEYAEQMGVTVEEVRAQQDTVCEDYVAKIMRPWDIVKSPTGTFVRQVDPGLFV